MWEEGWVHFISTLFWVEPPLLRQFGMSPLDGYIDVEPHTVTVASA